MAPIRNAVLGRVEAPQDGHTALAALRSEDSEIQRQVGLFATHKMDARKLGEYLLKQFRFLGGSGALDDSIQRIAGELAGCSSWLHFKQHPGGKRKAKLYRADFCNHRLLCNNCARRYAFLVANRVWRRIGEMWEKRPGSRAYFWTLTIPNSNDLPGSILLIRRALVKLLNRGRKWNTGPMRHVLGGYVSYEVTRGNDAKWHPHIHCIFMLAPGQRIDASELRQEWDKLTGGRQIYVAPKPITKREDLLEVFKYSLKVSKSGPDGLSLADRAIAYFLLRGMRLREAYGCFRGISEAMDVDPGEAEEMATWEDLFFAWAGAGYKHVRSLTPWRDRV